MTAALRYAYNQILRGVASLNVPYVTNRIQVSMPTAWSELMFPETGNMTGFKTNWPGRGVFKMYNGIYTWSNWIPTDADLTMHFLTSYDQFMGVNKYGAARIF